MGLYRKKPVVIEARQYTRESRAEVIAWAEATGTGIDDDGAEYELENIIIRTLEGDHRAAPGDWIIRGVKGEFYPCKPDIFAATYTRRSSRAGEGSSSSSPTRLTSPGLDDRQAVGRPRRDWRNAVEEG